MNDEVILRDGIPLEKGIVLTTDYLDRNKELFTKYLNLWLLSPDLLLDEIQGSEDKKHWSLKPYQRVAIRASMRYRYQFWTKFFNPHICNKYGKSA